MKRIVARRAVLALTLAPLLAAGLCPTTPPEPGTFDIVVTSADPLAAGIFIEITGDDVTRAVEVGPKLTALDSVAGRVTRQYVVSGPLGVGETAFSVRVSDRESAPTVRVLQAARGASGGYAMLNASAFSFRSVLQSR